MAKVSKKANSKKSVKDAGNNKRQVKSPISLSASQKWLDQLNLSESYVSLFLGAVVVVVLSVVFFVFIREYGFKDTTDYSVTNSIVPTGAEINQTTYTLKEGEGLWDVAVKFYGDGYKWVDIAKANNLTEEQANKLGPGAKIIIPNLK